MGTGGQLLVFVALAQNVYHILRAHIKSFSFDAAFTDLEMLPRSSPKWSTRAGPAR